MNRLKLSQENPIQRQHVGLGPMGTAVFYSAHNQGEATFEQLFDGGAALIDSSLDAIGSGRLHGLIIDTNSDPLDAIRFVPDQQPFGVSAESRMARRALEALTDQEFCNFTDLTRYYQLTGQELAEYTETQPNSSVIEAKVGSIVYDDNQSTFTSLDQAGRAIAHSREVVIATGGIEKLHPDLEQMSDRVVQSYDLLVENQDMLLQKLEYARQQNQHTIYILGSGNSALGALGELTKLQESRDFDIVIAHRSKFYKNYASLEEALADGYEPTPDELSPQAPHQVNRVRGLRQAAFSVLTQAHQGELGNVRFDQFNGDLKTIDGLRDAGLIVQAFGYTSAMPRFTTPTGERIALQQEEGRDVVDEHDQLITVEGMPIPQAYRVGLGAIKASGWHIAGFVPEAALTKGPVNGIKAFQGPGGAGEQLLRQLLKV